MSMEDVYLTMAIVAGLLVMKGSVGMEDVYLTGAFILIVITAKGWPVW